MGTQIHFDAFQLELAGLDLRVVKQVIDDRQQGIGAGTDDPGVLALPPVEVRVQQQGCHADDAIHRRADLVADVREKLAPCTTRGLRLPEGLSQRQVLLRKLTLKLLDPALQGVVHRVFFTLGQMNMTSESSAQQRLLIVEDDVHMAYLLGYLAEREHFQVETIADGRQAVQRINAGPAVDLVLLDIMLPYADGFELLACLRANPAWQGVPVIILTSKTREHDAVRALDLGADDFLTKPFSPSELVARIRRRLRPPSVAPP